jgi:hypothetical protein
MKYKGTKIVEFEDKPECALCDFFNVDEDGQGFCALSNCKEFETDEDDIPLLSCQPWCELEKIEQKTLQTAMLAESVFNPSDKVFVTEGGNLTTKEPFPGAKPIGEAIDCNTIKLYDTMNFINVEVTLDESGNIKK